MEGRFSKSMFADSAVSVKPLKILHAPNTILLALYEKKMKILSVMEKASGTSVVNSAREIVWPINSSLLELTSKVSETFFLSLKTFFLCNSSNTVHSILYNKCLAIHVADRQTSC